LEGRRDQNSGRGVPSSGRRKDWHPRFWGGALGDRTPVSGTPLMTQWQGIPEEMVR